MDITVATLFITALARLTRSLAAEERDQQDRDQVSFGHLSAALASAVLGDGPRVIVSLCQWISYNEYSRREGGANDYGVNAEALRSRIARTFADAIGEAVQGRGLGEACAQSILRDIEACEKAEEVDAVSQRWQALEAARTAQDKQARAAERRQREHAESLDDVLSAMQPDE